MKDRTVRVRVDDEFIKQIQYLMTINGKANISDTIRFLVNKEYQKETCKQ